MSQFLAELRDKIQGRADIPMNVKRWLLSEIDHGGSPPPQPPESLPVAAVEPEPEIDIPEPVLDEAP